MDVRRVLYRISGKGANSRVVKGKDFIIRPNEKHEPVIYLKKEMLPEGIDEKMTFAMKLEPVSAIVNEDIYKALVKCGTVAGRGIASFREHHRVAEG